MAGVTSWEEFFKDFSYRPECEFHIVPSMGYSVFGVRLQIRRKVEDTYNPGRMITVIFNATLPEFGGMVDEAEALLYVRQEIHIMEKHEADEWIRYKGEMIFNPHGHERK